VIGKTRDEGKAYIEAYLRDNGPTPSAHLFAHLKSQGWRTHQASHDVQDLVRAGRVSRVDLDTGRVYRVQEAT
jgi:hypothetical protein